MPTSSQIILLCHAWRCVLSQTLLLTTTFFYFFFLQFTLFPKLQAHILHRGKITHLVFFFFLTRSAQSSGNFPYFPIVLTNITAGGSESPGTIRIRQKKKKQSQSAVETILHFPKKNHAH